MQHFGKVKPGSTLYVYFDTFDGGTGASITMTGLAATDIEIYKDGSVTQRASDTGYTLLDTDGIDIDTTTGFHGFSIDLSSNAAANFYEAGSHYVVVVNSVTVDAQTVTFIAADFTIGYEGAILDTTIATLASQTSFTLEDGSADNDAYNGSTVVVHDLASGIQVAQGFVSDYVGATKTVTLAADPAIFTMAAGDSISIFPATNVRAVGGTVQTAGDIPALVTTVDTVVDGIQTDLDNATDGLGAIKADTAAVLVDTADMQPKIGTPAGASVSADVAAVKADTAAVLVDTGTTLETHLTDIKGATFAGATDSLEAIRDRGDAAWTTGAGGSNPFVLQNTTIATLASQVSFTLTAGSADNDAYNGMLAIVEDSATATQKCIGVISDYVGATKTVTLREDPAVFTMAAGDTIDIVAVSPDVLDILADTADMQPKLGTPGNFGSGTSTIAANLEDMADNGTAAYDRSTDSLQAIRDRGDAAWITGGGGGLTQSINPILVVPPVIDLANTASVRLGILLTNTLDDLPTTAEITPGTITISRKAQGGTSWSAVVTAAAMSEQAGFVYYDEVFDSASGYAAGDMIRIQLESVSVTADANTYNITGATGVYVYSLIVEPMRGTDSAALASVATEARLAELDAANIPADLDAVLVDTADMQPKIGTPAADVSADIAAVKAETAAIVLDTNELQADWANGGRLDLILDARAAEASITALNDLSAAAVNAEVVDVLRTDTIPDSYATDGAQPTIAQAILSIQQFLQERAVSGTTVTVKKPDGTTTAMTFTLDDGTNPTNITRAT